MKKQTHGGVRTNQARKERAATTSDIATVPELVRTDLWNPRPWDVKAKRVQKGCKSKT